VETEFATINVVASKKEEVAKKKDNDIKTGTCNESSWKGDKL